MTDQIQSAVATYMQREAAAMKTPQGADHAEIIEQVAAELGVETDILTEAILDATFAGAN